MSDDLEIVSKKALHKMLEMADRIEQLEAALRGLIQAHKNQWHPMKINGAEWFTARTALEEKKDD